MVEEIDKQGSIAKALAVLEHIAEEDGAVAISEVSEALGLTKPTGHRIAMQLEEHGYLQRELGSRRFIVGDRLIELAINALRASFSQGPRRQIIQNLAAQVGETCNLGVLARNEVIYLDRVDAQWPLTVSFSSGSRVPIHCTANGKLLLANLTKKEREKILNAIELTRYTSNTIVDRDQLSFELESIRSQKYAIDNQEFLDGIICIAVGIRASRNRLLGGLAISVPSARVTTETILKYLPSLQEAADQLAATLEKNG